MMRITRVSLLVIALCFVSLAGSAAQDNISDGEGQPFNSVKNIDISSLTTTFASGTGIEAVGAGVYFDIENLTGTNITIKRWDINVFCDSVSEADISVYTRMGTSQGFEETMNGWTLVGNETVSCPNMLPEIATPLNVGDVDINSGDTIGIAMVIETANAGWRYTSGTGSNQTYNNGELEIRTGSGSNPSLEDASVFSPRVWNGTVYYVLSPPITLINNVTDTRDILTEHFVSAALDEPLQGVLIDFRVESGPNRGESSSPGECFPNSDCTTDVNGEVSWFYTGGPNPGTDSIRASYFNVVEQSTEFSNTLLVNWISPISLSPTSASSEVRGEHTVTALIEFDEDPIPGILVDFEIISGPNRGESSGPGECSPNADCTTDLNGEVSWTYQSGRTLGTDTIVASYFDEEFDETIDSNPALKTWVLPERAIPTISEWGLIATAVILGFVSLLVLRRRKVM